MDIADAGSRHIARCGRLESLVLMYCRDTTDVATERIGNLPNLKNYFASHSRISDRTPEILSRMLSLDGGPVPRAHPRELPTLTAFRIPTVVVLLIVFAPSQIAQSQVTGVPCQYEENCDCGVPGITLRWKAAYCMALSETDDFEHEGVQQCVARRDTEAIRKLRACQQNAHWKAMLCGVVHDKQNVQACIRDRTFIPSIVARGAPIALQRMD